MAILLWPSSSLFSQSEPQCVITGPVSYKLKSYDSNNPSLFSTSASVNICQTTNCVSQVTICWGDELIIDPFGCPITISVYRATTPASPVNTFVPGTIYPISSAGNIPGSATLPPNQWITRYTSSTNGSQHPGALLNDVSPGTYWMVFDFSGQNGIDGPNFLRVVIQPPLEPVNLTVCRGQNINLNATGCAMGYILEPLLNPSNLLQWSFPTGVQVGSTLSIPNIQSSITGTLTTAYNASYSLTGQLFNYSVPVNINVVGPSLPTLATALDNCVASQIVQIGNYNSSYFYSASLDINGTVYTGSPVLDVSSMNTNGQITLNYPAAASGSVTLSITATQNGAGAPFPCSQTASFSTSLDCCFQPGMATINNSSASQVFGTSTIVNNASYVINGNFVVDQDLDLRNCHLYFGKDAQMIVQSGKTLRLRNGSILEACGADMWKGIDLLTGADFSASGNTLIKDAKRAVESMNGANFNISNTTFENNLTGLYLATFNGNHSGRYFSTTFTKTGNLKNSGLSNPKTIGVEVLNVQNCRLGAVPCNPNHDWSLFQGLHQGIRVHYSGAIIHYNEFRQCNDGVYVWGEGLSSTAPHRFVQIGDDNSGCDIHHWPFDYCDPIIPGIQPELSPDPDAKVITNLFDRCNYGVHANRRTALNIVRNGFIDCSYGTRIRNVRSLFPNSVLTTYKYNRNYNTRFGFVGTESPAMRFKIRFNDFCINPSYPLYIETQGVSISRAAVQLGTPSNDPGDNRPIDISQNEIYNYTYGVQIVNSKGATIDTNEISMNPAVAMLPPGTPWSSRQPNAISLSMSPETFVSQNTLLGNNPNQPGSKGVSVDNSYECQIFDNCINQFNSGVAVADPSFLTRTFRNDFSDNLIGFYLHDGGFTGPNEYLYDDVENQVMWIMPQDNRWQRGPNTWQTYVQNADGTQSAWRFRSQPNNKPIEYQPDFSTTTGRGSFGSDPPIAYFNPTDPAEFFPTGKPCTLQSIAPGVMIEPSENANAGIMAALMDSMDIQLYQYLPAHQAYKQDLQMYYQIILDSIDYTQYASLSQLMARLSGTEVERIYNLEELIDQMISDGTAQSLTALEAFAQQIGGTSYPAELSQQFYELYVPHLEDSVYAFSAVEIDSLHSWAQKCPYIYGQAVYQSRALLAEVADTLMGKTHCEVAYTTAQPSSKTDDWQNTSKLEQAQLYPNPVAPGEPVYLELETDAERIALYDLNGRCVKEWQGAAQSQWTLEMAGLPQGLYLGRAMGSDGKIQYFKLCIAY